MALISGFRSDLSLMFMIDGNSGNVSAGVLFSKVAYQRKRWCIQRAQRSRATGEPAKHESSLACQTSTRKSETGKLICTLSFT